LFSWHLEKKKGRIRKRENIVKVGMSHGGGKDGIPIGKRGGGNKSNERMKKEKRKKRIGNLWSTVRDEVN
jgi:hypothetical protein